MNGDQLDKIVRVKFGDDRPNGLAYVVGYAPHPTYSLIRPNGDRMHWAVHLCEPATPEEAAAYWRDRAEWAEARLQAKELEELSTQTHPLT